MELTERLSPKFLGYQDLVTLAEGVQLQVDVLNDRKISFKLVGPLTLVLGPALGDVVSQLTASWVLLLGSNDFLPLGRCDRPAVNISTD